jgi:membrane protease YdiL (CAAX protease family)
MIELFKEVFAYLKNPVLEKDENTNVNYQFLKFFKLLGICLIAGFAISPIFGILEAFNLINLENHAAQEMMKNMSKIQVVFFAVILAPLIEELIFRGPLLLFKNPKYFKIAFYTLAVLFGFVHLTNFEITQNILLLSPILVLPQILLGGYLGFICVKFGLHWSILLHAGYNGILIGFSFLFNFQ